MSADPKAMVQKLWDFCDVLRDDGLSYGDYVEQLTYLLFLKMADEQNELLGQRVVPIGYDWITLLNRSGTQLEAQYNMILAELGSYDDMLGVVFRKARNRIQNPAKLEQLIKEFIDQHEWMSYDADLKGDAYEGLIEKTAQEGARGAGQYFTPRALISAIVDVMLPEPTHRICDPACGTGGFFLGAYESIVKRFPHLSSDQAAHLRSGAFTGWEIADLPARLCAMNLLLHGIESPDSDSPINVDDALRDDSGERFDMVLTNPPFGKSSSDSYEREDFWATTKNKQLNFVQHVVSLLKVAGGGGGGGALLQWSCPTMCCLRLVLVKPSAAVSYMTAMSTHFCAYLPAFSMPKVSRPMCYFLIVEKVLHKPGPKSCGCTTFAPTSILPSSRILLAEPTWTTLWTAITLLTVISVKKLSALNATATKK